MKTLTLLAGGALGFLALVGCGPTCQSTCDQVYIQCDVQKAGRTPRESTDDCVAQCNTALARVGDLGGYNPEQFRTDNLEVVLENDSQAAAWMDCVWNHAPDATPEQCDEIDPQGGNFCDPI